MDLRSGLNYNFLSHKKIYEKYKSGLSGLNFLGIEEKVDLQELDMLNQKSVEKLIEEYQPNEFYNLAAQSSVGVSFKKPVAHGMLGASFISTIIGTKLPGDGALWYSQSLEFLRPVRVDDTLKIVAIVTKKVDRTKTIELQTDVYNQHKQKVTSGKAKVRVIESTEKNNQVEETIGANSVLVIGGTGGIGSATCLQLAKDGFNVAIHYHNNRKKAENLKKTIIKNLISDGVLVSTPAGSTAYNLSAHGPILNLDSNKLTVTPISPFRPRRWRGTIISDKSKITIKNLDINKRPISAVADNFEVRNVKKVIIKSNKKIIFNLLYNKNNSLYKKIKIEQVRKETLNN